MARILFTIGLCLQHIHSARLKSHSTSDHGIVLGQFNITAHNVKHGLGVIGNALHSAFRANIRHEDSSGGNSMWIMVLVLGIVIGWSLFSCCSKVLQEPKVVINEMDDAGTVSTFSRFTRAIRSSVKNVIPQVLLQDETDAEPERIILVETLYRVPSANKLIVNDRIDTLNLPDMFCAWEPVSCALVEATDGLYMCVADERCESKTRLVQWSGNPLNYVEVDTLPEIKLVQETRSGASSKYRGSMSTFGEDPDTDQDPESRSSMNLTMGGVNFARHISMRTIPTDHKVVTTLHPFIVRFGEESSKTFLLVAGDEEGTCSKWVKNLRMYSQIRKRFNGALLWKLNADVVANLPPNFEEARDYLADIRNWRRRLCFLEQLHTQNSLCITYMSEKADDGAVANILAKAGEGSRASIDKMPEIPVAFMTSWDSEHVRSNVLQYYISVFGSRSDQECVLPSVLHGFQVSLPESLAAAGGHAHSIYAFDDAVSLESWLGSMDVAIQSLGSERGSWATQLSKA